MLLGVAALYSLLMLRVYIRLEASLWDGQGSLGVQISAAVFQLRSDAQIGWKHGKLDIVPRSGKRWKRNAGRRKERIAFQLLKIALRNGWLRDLQLEVRIGLDDACHTALAAGALQSLAAALLRGMRCPNGRQVRIEPDFQRTCLCGCICCIFSCRLGDGVLAACKAAVPVGLQKNKPSENRWLSRLVNGRIPSSRDQ